MDYLFLKALHIVSVVLFLGNIITGVFWKMHADRTRDLRARAQALDGIIRSDRIFTTPGVFLIIGTGVWLAYIRVGSPGGWFEANPLSHVVQLKLGLLAATVGLALHARLRLIPRLRDDNLPALASHIVIVTILAIGFVLAGALFRFGGAG